MDSLRKSLATVISTSFGLGFIPLVPATWTSAVAAIALWFIPDPALVYCVVVLSVAGCWACQPSREIFHAEDPKQFVMDEVCGMILTLIWLPKTIVLYVAGFFLFRVLDVWKPWPISRIQNSKHPWSIMGDDLLAGVFANIILQFAVRAFIKL